MSTDYSSITSRATSAAAAVSPYAPDRRRRRRDATTDSTPGAVTAPLGGGPVTSRMYTYCRRLAKVAAICMALRIMRTFYERRRGRRRVLGAAAESSEAEDDEDDGDHDHIVKFIANTNIEGLREALSLLRHRLAELTGELLSSAVRRDGWTWKNLLHRWRCLLMITTADDGDERGRTAGCLEGGEGDGCGSATRRDVDPDDGDASRSSTAWRWQQRQDVDRDQLCPAITHPPRHRGDVDSVLNFWYASSPSKSQKSLWMITDATKLESTDALISFEFGSLLTRLVSMPSLREEWSSASHYGYEGSLALILILDQFSRHILRHHSRIIERCRCKEEEEEDSTLGCHRPSQGDCDALALEAARHFHSTFHDQIRSGRIPTVCRVFALLPYRHSGTLADVKFVQSCVEDEMEIMGGEEAALLRRFRSATNRRMNVLLDEVRRTTRSTTSAITTSGGGAALSTPISIGREGGSDAAAFTDEDILECHARDAPLTPEELVEARSHPVVNVIRTFLLDRGLRPVDDSKVEGGVSESDRIRREGRRRPRRKRGTKGKEVGGGSSLDTKCSSPAKGNKDGSKVKQGEEKEVCGQGGDDAVPTPMSESVSEGGGGSEGPGGDVPPTSSSHSKSKEAKRSPRPPTPIIVSLSGGVDSMVIARALSLLSDPSSPTTYNFSLKIIGAHIDYANRPESAAEGGYVMRYCDAIGLKYRVRRIDEVTRGVTARDEYEKVARATRYDFYRCVLKEEGVECRSDSIGTIRGEGVADDAGENDNRPAPVGIVLGHHLGDLRENVLSNSCKGCGPLDLSGMTEVGTVEGVEVWRPLLPLEKDHVYDFAHRFGVPYFKDTTPLWSTRGKLRNRLLPLIQEVYGEGSMTNLSKLATESDSARALLLDSVVRPFFDEVRRRPMGVSFPTLSPWKERGPFFWRFVLRDVLHSVGRGMFSDGAMASFLGRVGADPVRPGWLQCRRDYAVYLDADGTVHVFHPETFPWAKEDQYDCVGQAIQLGRDNAVHIGPWTVSAEVEQGLTSEKASTLLSQKAYCGMDDIMRGHLSYYLKVPRNCAAGPPMVVVKGFTRTSRPQAWKSTDSRVQSTLPLVGNSEAARKCLDAESSFDSCMVVRVDLTINGISIG